MKFAKPFAIAPNTPEILRQALVSRLPTSESIYSCAWDGPNDRFVEYGLGSLPVYRMHTRTAKRLLERYREFSGPARLGSHTIAALYDNNIFGGAGIQVVAGGQDDWLLRLRLPSTEQCLGAEFIAIGGELVAARLVDAYRHVKPMKSLDVQRITRCLRFACPEWYGLEDEPKRA